MGQKEQKMSKAEVLDALCNRRGCDQAAIYHLWWRAGDQPHWEDWALAGYDGGYCPDHAGTELSRCKAVTVHGVAQPITINV